MRLFPPACLYLHGFASSPHSAKGIFLKQKFQSEGISLQLPDLNQEDFSHLTLTRQIAQVEKLLFSESALLIGSSLGGLVAAWVAERNVQVSHLVLLAPAFNFVSYYQQRLGAEVLNLWQQQGYRPVFHYHEQREIALHYQFLVDAQQYHDQELSRPLPTLILHGLADEVIPIEASRHYQSSRPWVRLVELESDHALTHVQETIWQELINWWQNPN
jgi:hypothetical protein